MTQMPTHFRSMAAILAVVVGLGIAVPAAAVDLDKDDDGLTDEMEANLARKFFPNLWMSTLQDRNSFYGCGTGDPEVAVPYTVEPVWYSASFASGLACLVQGDCLLFKVGVAYHRDFGDPTYGGVHQGDSEHYLALLSRVSFDRTIVKKNAAGQTCSAYLARQDADCWWVMVDWTSAHQGTAGESSYHAVISPFLNTIGDGKARTVYSAEGKHANYHSDQSCDQGNVFSIDDCKPRYNVRDTCHFPLRNIGNSPALGGDGLGDGYDSWIRYPDSTGGLYDMWGGQAFGGSSAYRPKLDVNGSYLWSRWYNCVFAGSASQKAINCGNWDLGCSSGDLCTCNDACSPNRSYLACGNGVCSPGETCSSCAADCGACPGGGGGGGGGGAVCGNGLCETGEACQSGGGSGQCQADCGCCEGWKPVCFVAGTPVTLADGSQRSIEAIAVGDRVLAYDERRGMLVPSRVSRVYTTLAAQEELVRINDSVVATASHPFYTGRGLVAAGELQPGDKLLTLGRPPGTGPDAGSLGDLPVASVETLGPADTVYNLEVDAEHNFFAGGLLVHNKTATGGCEPDGPAEF